MHLNLLFCTLRLTPHGGIKVIDKKLDFWFKNGRNVLFVGKHGVGKTALIKSCFERNGLNHGETYLYFSASTLDPWVDLCGVPEKTVSPEGIPYLELVRPKALATGKVVAIFFDEFNRSVKKVRNAVMELLQFKSINGLVFPNLKCVWAAINPEEDDVYDVEKIDPAQKDRFHIIQPIAYKPNKDWFVKRFGNQPGSAAIEWWNDLPEEEKNKVSPRRLEYALEEFELGGSLQDILPVSANINKLLQGLKNGPIESKLKEIFETSDIVNGKIFLANDNNYLSSIKIILSTTEYMEFFVPLMPKEKICSLMSENANVCRFVTQASQKDKNLWNIMREIVMAGQDDKLVKMLHRYVNNDDIEIIQECVPENPDKPVFNKKPKNISFTKFHNISQISMEKSDEFYKELTEGVGENLDWDEALNCLIAVADITKNCWSTTLLKPEYKNLTGLVNHCLMQMKKNADVSNVLEYVSQSHANISKLFVKMHQINTFKNVVRV